MAAVPKAIRLPTAVDSRPSSRPEAADDRGGDDAADRDWRGGRRGPASASRQDVVAGHRVDHPRRHGLRGDAAGEERGEHDRGERLVRPGAERGVTAVVTGSRSSPATTAGRVGMRERDGDRVERSRARRR